MPFLSSLPSLSGIYARLHCLPRLRGRLSFASNSDIAVNSDRRQDVLCVYSLNAIVHPERVESAVGRALVNVWPDVVGYAAEKKLTGQLWAQIRCVPSSAFADFWVTLGAGADVAFTRLERQVPPPCLRMPPFAFTI
jgi:hypothetical protein